MMINALVKMKIFMEAAKVCLVNFMGASAAALSFILVAIMVTEVKDEKNKAIEKAVDNTVLALIKKESRRKSMKMRF